ncbi:hypothetical protein, partial [Phocaeicola abscessus]|uniref:hypothetical protein n=1 Tax=Phocaeicola abscessus TaxID=555313 RepID=UPI0028E71D74
PRPLPHREGRGNRQDGGAPHHWGAAICFQDSRRRLPMHRPFATRCRSRRAVPRWRISPYRMEAVR